MDMESTQSQIYAMELLLLSPIVRSDPDQLRQMLSDSFYEYGSSGKVYHYHPGDTFGGGPLYEGDWEILDFSLRKLSEDTALCTYRIIKHSEEDAQKRKTLRVSLWKMESGFWKMQFHQGKYASPDSEEENASGAGDNAF